MEMEAVQKEKASLESQLAALMKQINDLTSELDSQKTKVHQQKKTSNTLDYVLLHGEIRNDFFYVFLPVICYGEESP